MGSRPTFQTMIFRSAFLATLCAGCASRAPERAPAAAALLPAKTPAATPVAPPPSGLVTLQEAVRQAIERNGDIAVARAVLESAGWRRRAAADWRDPELEMTWMDRSSEGTRREWSAPVSGVAGTPVLPDRRAAEESGDDRTGYRIGVRLPIPHLWQVTPGIAARRAEENAARSSLNAAIQAVVCNVHETFENIRYAEEDSKFASEMLDQQRVMLDAVKKRAERGAAAPEDWMALARRVLQSQQEYERIRLQHRQSLRQLAALLDMPVGEMRIEFGSPVVGEIPEIPVSAAQDRDAASRRSDVEASHWNTLAARGAYRAARNIRIPWFKEISGSYSSMHSDGWAAEMTAGAGLERAWVDDRAESGEWRIGFAVDVPIFSWFFNHESRAMFAEYRMAAVQEVEVLRRATREIADARDALEDARRQWQEVEENLVPALKTLDQAIAAMESAPATLPDRVAAARVQRIEMLRIRGEAAHRYRMAYLESERVTGSVSP